jgi:hypothetical protein
MKVSYSTVFEQSADQVWAVVHQEAVMADD